jgi:hypothetical protein
LIKRIRPATPPPVEDGGWLALGDDAAVGVTSRIPNGLLRALSQTRHPRAGGRVLRASDHHSRMVGTCRNATHSARLRELIQARTQEFVLRAATGDGEREIVRQQFTFSPPGTTLEREEYTTELRGVKRLKLMIVPAIDDHHAVATLKEWRVGRVPAPQAAR